MKKSLKQLAFVKNPNGSHWVGDGFPVQNIFSYSDIAEEISPFLMMDYAGPAYFPPTERRLGVGEHPHRGFETVTIVYQGEVEHRDSSGGGGKIGPGDVQWMTAASGVVHEEFHGRDFARRGGDFEMIQLWVDLPRADKMTTPRYQGIVDQMIPRVAVEGGGQVRVIAGSYFDAQGPAQTFSPIQLWDVRLPAGQQVVWDFREGDTTTLFVLRGELVLASGKTIGSAQLGVLRKEGTQVGLKALKDSVFIVLAGTPLGQPVVGYGPFVMTTEAEIRQALIDYRSGRMGRLDGSRN